MNKYDRYDISMNKFSKKLVPRIAVDGARNADRKQENNDVKVGKR